jgi:hypothetical protein
VLAELILMIEERLPDDRPEWWSRIEHDLRVQANIRDSRVDPARLVRSAWTMSAQPPAALISVTCARGRLRARPGMGPEMITRTPGWAIMSRPPGRGSLSRR